jgi:hypothetical protein
LIQLLVDAQLAGQRVIIQVVQPFLPKENQGEDFFVEGIDLNASHLKELFFGGLGFCL